MRRLYGSGMEINMNFAKLDAFMEEMPLRGYPGCELAVSLNGETVYRKNVGFADKDKTRPLSGNDISWIFSCSKVITCLAAMRLVDEGKLSIEDPVSKYIPEFENLTVYNKKTGERCFQRLPALLQTGDEGIEPPPKVLETPIIPLDQSPVCICRT